MRLQWKSIETRTIRFHRYGEPSEVLQLEEATLPSPAPNRIRVRVVACGLNPADWALCRGLFAKDLPRGIGLDVSGTVDALGESVGDVAVGDKVFGAADFVSTSSAGAADFAILDHWARIPADLDPVTAAALPMAVYTAFGAIDLLEVQPGQTILINGAGGMVGFAAAQMALMRGARVIATARETFADRLRELGADVTEYGEGLVERIAQLTDRRPDLILDTAPVGGALPDLVKIAGNPKRVMTISDFAAAKEIGVRSNIEEAQAVGKPIPYHVLGEFAELAAEGKFAVPIARTYPLDAWREALGDSLNHKAHGKLILLP